MGEGFQCSSHTKQTLSVDRIRKSQYSGFDTACGYSRYYNIVRILYILLRVILRPFVGTASQTTLKNMRSIPRVLAVFPGSLLWIRVLFRMFVLRVLLVLTVLHRSYPQHSQYLDHSVPLILSVLAASRPPVLQYSQYSEYEMYSVLPSMEFTGRICEPY